MQNALVLAPEQAGKVLTSPNEPEGRFPLLPEVRKSCAAPDLWPVAFALAIVHAITLARSVLDPCVALTIVMESAVPMSKIDLGAA